MDKQAKPTQGQNCEQEANCKDHSSPKSRMPWCDINSKGDIIKFYVMKSNPKLNVKSK